MSPGPDDDPHEVREALLGPDRRHDLAVGVELDPEASQVEVGDGLAELGDPAAGRVAVVAGVVDGLGQLLDGDVRRGNVGVPEAEVDDVVTGAAPLQLQLVDLREDVRQEVLESCEAPSFDVSPCSPRSCKPANHRASVTRSIERGQPQIAHAAPAARRPKRCRSRSARLGRERARPGRRPQSRLGLEPFQTDVPQVHRRASGTCGPASVAGRRSP